MADQGAEGLLSPWLRTQRIKAVLPYLQGNVLDFGCGSGALAGHIPYSFYLGVDIDEFSLQKAQLQFPRHRFVSDLQSIDEKFDSVVSLAVIEHVNDPSDFLRRLARCLNKSTQSKLILTTPHPSAEWIHNFGAKFGIFSKHANEEHEDLLDREKLYQAGKKADLNLVFYRRFCFVSIR